MLSLPVAQTGRLASSLSRNRRFLIWQYRSSKPPVWRSENPLPPRLQQTESGSFHVNPRPGGGLSHLRHGGGGGQNDPPPPLTLKLGKLEGRAIRRSTALSEPVRSHFGHFFAQVNIEVSRGHRRSNFRKMMVLSGMPAIISGTIIATRNPKKAKDSS